MTSEALKLNIIRDDIDRIDDKIFHLLQERTACVAEIGKVKQSSGSKNPLRPAREAQILRRLLNHPQGDFPVLSLVHIFREIVASHCKKQGNFAIAYCASDDDNLAVRDLVRFYYGMSTPMTSYRGASQVLQAISKNAGIVGVLPAPEITGQAGAWWLNLAGGETDMSIIGRIPFVLNENFFENTVCYIVADTVLQPSGDDLSVLVVVTPSEISRTTITSLMQEMGYKAQTLSVYDDLQASVRHHLVQVEAYIDKQDQEVLQDKFLLNAGGKVLSTRLIGVMPRPIAV